MEGQTRGETKKCVTIVTMNVWGAKALFFRNNKSMYFPPK